MIFSEVDLSEVDDDDVNQLIEHHHFEKNESDDETIKTSDDDDVDECDDESLVNSDDDVNQLADDLSERLSGQISNDNLVNIANDSEFVSPEDVEPLSVSNSQYRPFRDSKVTQPYYACNASVASSSLSQIEIKQRVKKQISKQQKAYINRRLKKGEASLVNKQRKELKRDVEDSKDFYLL